MTLGNDRKLVAEVMPLVLPNWECAIPTRNSRDERRNWRKTRTMFIRSSTELLEPLTRVAVLAEISLRSPQKFFIFTITL